MDNFDVHEWNKKRYLNKIEESDDPKMGAELEAGVEGDRVEENKSHLEFLSKYLGSMHPDLDFYVSDHTDRIDVRGSQQDMMDWGNKNHGKKFGDFEVFHTDDDDRGEIVRIVKSDSIMRGKLEEGVVKDMHTFLNDLRDSGVTNMFGAAPYLQKEFGIDQKSAREVLANWMQSFSENLNEYSKYDNVASYGYKGYKDKHFDICPAAEGLRDRLLAGEFKDNKWATGTNFEKEVGEWLYRHDILFQIEKQVLRDKEGDQSDVEDAKKAVDRIVNLSRDLGIPAAEISYLKAHLKKIKDIVEYSSLTEKEDDEFAGSDPKAGSTIQGTGFDWKKKDSIKETLLFIKEHNPEFTNEEIKTELKEIKELGSQLNEKLCKKGEAYRKRRMAAGEKSSAYLSGRAVKVCKGQMSGKKKKK